MVNYIAKEVLHLIVFLACAKERCIYLKLQWHYPHSSFGMCGRSRPSTLTGNQYPG